MSNTLIPADWLTYLSQFNQLIVGFSGGLDSSVLLHALASQQRLRQRLLAVHITHGISQNASTWQAHCQKQCANLGVDFVAHTVAFDSSANIEEAARMARYAVFSSLLKPHGALILAHHQDDQAETLLLQLFRGAGVDGLAGMTQVCAFEKGTLLRPFLSYSRQHLEQYAACHALTWVEDESNQDCKYSRNFLRREVLPLLATKWPGVVGNLARTATHCQQAKINLEALAIQDCQELQTTTNVLSIEQLKNVSFERTSNILRVWLKQNTIQLPSTKTFERLIHEVIHSKEDATPEVSWDNVLVRRYRDTLYLDKKNSSTLPMCSEWVTFPVPFVLPNHVTISPIRADDGLHVPKGATVEIRFRQGGEAFVWHGQTKQLKKLMQEWGIAPWLRDKVPLLYVDNQLAVVVGYAISDDFLVSGDAWTISVS